MSAVLENTNFVTNLDIEILDAHTLNVNFSTLPGNQPQTYGNFISIWQNFDQIPYNQAPLKSFPMINNTAQGSQVIDGLTLTSNAYIVGYSVGPTLGTGQQTYGNVCSTVYIPAGEDPSPVITSTIATKTISSTSASFSYALPPGNQPKTNGAWIGLWEGEVASFTTPPGWSSALSTDLSKGTAAINNVSIGRKTTYTVALFTSGWDAGGSGKPGLRAMAAIHTFTS